MANGFFLGGVADGANQARQTGIQQQQVDQQGSFQQKSLALQEQAQKNQQQRELYARADKDVANLMGVADETIKNLKLAGKDNATIAKAIQPIVQQAKKLKQSAGGDPSMIDAQVAATLATPGVDPNAFGGGSSSGAPAAPAPAAGPTPAAAPAAADTGGGSPMPPGQNLTGPDKTITGIDYGPTEYRNAQGKPVAAPQPPVSQPAAPNPQAAVDHWTRTLATLPTYASPQMKDAAKLRLAEALKAAQPEADVKFLKDEDGNEHPVVIHKQGGTVKITDTNGNPYVSPVGDNPPIPLNDKLLSGVDPKIIPKIGSVTEDGVVVSKHMKVALAMAAGLQPPTTTGLYKQGAKVREDLATIGLDQTSMMLQYSAAQQQVKSLNSHRMIYFKGLAGSVVNTIDEARSLSQQLKNGGVTALNAAKIQTLIHTAGNTRLGQLATRYMTTINTLKEEFANLANGGYAPTDAAWTLANQQINGNYGMDQLDAGLSEVQRLLRYRINAIPNLETLGPGGNNRYIDSKGAQPSGGQPPSAAPSLPPPPPGFVVTSPR